MFVLDHPGTSACYNFAKKSFTVSAHSSVTATEEPSVYAPGSSTCAKAMITGRWRAVTAIRTLFYLPFPHVSGAPTPCLFR